MPTNGESWFPYHWFDLLAILLLILQQRIVFFAIEVASDFVQTGENVTRRSSIFAALCTIPAKSSHTLFEEGTVSYHQSGSELTSRVQEIDVVRTNKVLRHADDSSGQTLLAMVVSAVLAYITKKPNT